MLVSLVFFFFFTLGMFIILVAYLIYNLLCVQFSIFPLVFVFVFFLYFLKKGLFKDK